MDIFETFSESNVIKFLWEIDNYNYVNCLADFIVKSKTCAAKYTHLFFHTNRSFVAIVTFAILESFSNTYIKWVILFTTYT